MNEEEFIHKQYILAFGSGVLITGWAWWLCVFLIIVDLKFLEGQITYRILDILYYGLVIEMILLIIVSIGLYIFSKKGEN